MRRGGVEPPRPFGQRLLRPSRMPVPPPPREERQYSEAGGALQAGLFSLAGQWGPRQARSLSAGSETPAAAGRPPNSSPVGLVGQGGRGLREARRRRLNPRFARRACRGPDRGGRLLSTANPCCHAMQAWIPPNGAAGDANQGPHPPAASAGDSPAGRGRMGWRAAGPAAPDTRAIGGACAERAGLPGARTWYNPRRRTCISD